MITIQVVQSLRLRCMGLLIFSSCFLSCSFPSLGWWSWPFDCLYRTTYYDKWKGELVRFEMVNAKSFGKCRVFYIILQATQKSLCDYNTQNKLKRCLAPSFIWECHSQGGLTQAPQCLGKIKQLFNLFFSQNTSNPDFTTIKVRISVSIPGLQLSKISPSIFVKPNSSCLRQWISLDENWNASPFMLMLISSQRACLTKRK